MTEVLTDIIKHSLMITAFVLVMMLIIEFVNVYTKGAFNNLLKSKGWLQIVLATILGLIPGCLGTFTVVSLYTHNILGFGALISALIATSGDEAFFMFSMMPEAAVKIHIILFLVAIFSGLIVDKLFKSKVQLIQYEKHFEIHESEKLRFDLSELIANFKNISFPKALLFVGILLFILGLLTGNFNDSHLHSHDEHELHEVQGFFNFESNWVNVTFLVTSLISLLIISFVPEHFIEEHLWKHIIKKHFLKVLLWTFGALILTSLITSLIDVKMWISDNLWIILIIAVLIGVIPESGPHMIFISLYMSGAIPMSILIANSIVQDGHGAIPLLAESKKSFFYAKLINIAISLLVGGVGLFLE